MPEEYAEFGDGIPRPVVAHVKHEAEGGFVVDELVVGRHAGQVQDGATVSVFTIRYPSGASGAVLYSTLDEAREAARQEARHEGSESGSTTTSTTSGASRDARRDDARPRLLGVREALSPASCPLSSSGVGSVRMQPLSNRNLVC